MAHELSEALRGNARALRGSNLKIFHESCADELDSLQALNAELVAALKALNERWEVFTGPDCGGWGNQEQAYYALAKHAQKEWAAAQEAIKKAESQ